MANEIADAYIALYTKMPGVKKDIERAIDASGAGQSAGNSFSAGFAGIVGGAMAAVTSKAITTVTSSINDAIARVDTINNFPKIMQNLGYSSDEAAASVATMSARLAGLPTSLDSMTGIVQMLAPLTGGLSEATEISLALNNAMLAGGKNTEIQANAMEQYTQMLAVGKVDMAAWRSLVTAMPGQMDQLSQSLLGAGSKSMDLYAALQDGTLGFDEFNAAIVRLNSEGTGEFASFAQQAKDSTGGIATQQANLQTAITRGLANLIQKFLPVITTGMSTLTAAANGAFSGLIEFVDWLGANSDWVAPLGIALGVVAAGFMAVNAAAAIAAAGGLAKWIAATKIGAATQLAFNLVMNANPIMLVITAIAALVAGLVYFFTQTELGKQVWENITNAIGAAVTWLGEAFTWLWEEILQPVFQAIGAVFTWLYENVIKPVIDAIGAVFTWLWTSVIKPVSDFISDAVGVIGQIIQWVYETSIKPAIDAIGAAFQWVWGSIIKPVADFIAGAIRAVGDTVRNVFGGIASFIGSAFQAVLGVVRGPINALIDLINGIIGGLNSIRVDIPDWVPIVGGQTFGVNIPRIPRLAEGGIVSRRPGGIMANIGEGRYDEAVVPLSPQVLAQLGGGGIQPGDRVIFEIEGQPFTAIAKRVVRAEFPTRGAVTSQFAR